MFDRYVEQTKPSWKRRALIIASIALHGIAGVVLVVWSFFHVDEIAPPALSLTFFSAAPPPPPPPPPPPKASSTPKSEKPKIEKPKDVVQPTHIKPIIQPQEKEPEPKKEEEHGEEGGEEGGEKGGVVGGQKGGVQGGVIGGVVGGQVGGTGTGPGGGAAPKMVASFVLARDQIDHPDPKLPDWYKNQNAGKTVVGMYKVCLRSDGRVMSVNPMTSIQGADQVLMDHIRSSWTYKPQPVPVCFVAQLKFLIR